MDEPNIQMFLDEIRALKERVCLCEQIIDQKDAEIHAIKQSLKKLYEEIEE